MVVKPLSFDRKLRSYCGLVLVVLLWGIAPLVTLYFYNYYSPTIRIAFSSFVCSVVLFLIAWPNRKLLDHSYFKVAVPTGFFLSLANILQKIGLQYTTPTHYAFLENLSCLTVPILLIFFIRKKPSVLTILSSLLCLAGSFILTGMTAGDSGSASVTGDLLCALAGILYGVNIAGTGAFAKKLYAPLYLLVQMLTETVVSLVGAFAFHTVGLEPIRFSFHWTMLLANITFVFISSTMCWLIRTNAMKHVDATVVAVMMPFSSVVTAVVSIMLGTDRLSPSLVLGSCIGLAAIILSAFGDRPAKKPAKPTE